MIKLIYVSINHGISVKITGIRLIKRSRVTRIDLACPIVILRCSVQPSQSEYVLKTTYPKPAVRILSSFPNPPWANSVTGKIVPHWKVYLLCLASTVFKMKAVNDKQNDAKTIHCRFCAEAALGSQPGVVPHPSWYAGVNGPPHLQPAQVPQPSQPVPQQPVLSGGTPASSGDSL